MRFQNEVLNEFRCYLATPALVQLSNRLLIAATAIDSNAADGDTIIVLINELASIEKGFAESEYKKRFEVVLFIHEMRNELL